MLDKNFNPGAYVDRPDERDKKYEDLVFGAVNVDWQKGYDVEKKLNIKLKRENQNGSKSCVAQAWSKYAEVLNYVETGRLVDLSAKSLYEQIYLPQGGAYIRDGGKSVVKGGVAKEIWVPSYMNGKPPTEQYMRKQMITPEIRQKMKTYQAKEYRSIGPANPDLLALAIKNNYGAVGGARGDNVGWSSYIVKPPTSSNTWGHAYYYVAYGQDNKGKWFEFLNSWGDKWGKNGRGRMYFEQYNMPQNTFGVWTLVDKPNQTYMQQIEFIKLVNNSTVWIKWLDNTRSYIFNWEQFLEISKRFNKTKDDIKIVTEQELNSLPMVNPMVVIK